jgi:hypothetical protein
LKRVIGPQVGLIAPILIEEISPIETHELMNQLSIRVIRRRIDLEVSRSEKFRKVVKPERHFADDAEGSAAASLQRPKQIRIGARIRDLNLAVRRDNFGFEQIAGGGPIAFGMAPKAPALNEAAQADSCASAALNISPAFRGYRLVRLHPDCSCADCHPPPLIARRRLF